MLRRCERPEWAINPAFRAARVNRRVGCEQSLADLAVNGEDAPIPAVRWDATELLESTLNRRSRPRQRITEPIGKQTFVARGEAARVR
jgi:hypothetical protein